MLIEELSNKGLVFPDRLIQLAFGTQEGGLLPIMALVQESDDQSALMANVNRLQYRERDGNLEVVIKNEADKPLVTITKDSQRLIGASTDPGGFFVEACLEDGKWRFSRTERLTPSEEGEIVLFLDPPTNPQTGMPVLRGMRVWEDLMYPLNQMMIEIVDGPYLLNPEV